MPTLLQFYLSFCAIITSALTVYCSCFIADSNSFVHFFLFFFRSFFQIVTPEQVSNLEGKVAQCEAALATCRLNRKNASASAKESAIRVKAIEIEVLKNNPIENIFISSSPFFDIYSLLSCWDFLNLFLIWFLSYMIILTQLEKLDLEINRMNGQVAILILRLEVLQKDVKLSPAEIKDMEVLEVRTYVMWNVFERPVLSISKKQIFQWWHFSN